MRKLAIPTLILAAVVAAGAWFWQSGSLGSRKGLSAYVPADTGLYFGGRAHPEVVERMANYPIGSLDPRQLEQLVAEMQAQQDESTPGMRLMQALLLDFSAHAGTYGELYTHYGLDVAREQAIYLHGLFPVLRLPIADQAAFEQVWSGITEQSGVAPLAETLEGAALKRWRLSRPGAPDYLDLVVAQQDGLATITFFSSLDSETDRLERVGLRTPARSLADSGELTQLMKAQGYTDTFAGFVHIQRIAEGLLEATDSRLARNVAQIRRLSGKPNPFTADLEAGCRDEIAGLFAAVPRFSAGYQQVSVDGDSVTVQMRSLLEIAAPAISEPLQALRGHLPGHLDAEQMLGVGFGIDMDALVPTLTRLWSGAGERSFQCPRLQQLQQQMVATSPAPLGVVTGMMQGIKGIGFSLYDLGFADASGLPDSVDFLFSLATENPELVISLFNTTVVPQSNGRVPKMPLDGALTDVDLSFLSPGLTATLGRQGQHLVLYAGEQGSRAAAALAGETLTPNGTSALHLDYPRVAQWFATLPDSMLSQLAGANDEFCLLQARVRQVLASQPMRLHYVTDLEAAGAAGSARVEMLPMNPALGTTGALPGRYELRDLNQNCGQPPMIGEEIINADGTGRYVEYDATGQCETLRYDYRWERYGERVLFDVQGGEFRDSCSDGWQSLSAHEASCELLPAEGGFDCIYTDDEGEGLYRYQRMP